MKFSEGRLIQSDTCKKIAYRINVSVAVWVWNKQSFVLIPVVFNLEEKQHGQSRGLVTFITAGPGRVYRQIINPLRSTGWAVQLTVISWKMPRTSQSTFFIFQVIKLPLYWAAGNTLINTIGRSKLSHSRNSFSATGCYKNKYSIQIS